MYIASPLCGSVHRNYEVTMLKNLLWRRATHESDLNIHDEN